MVQNNFFCAPFHLSLTNGQNVELSIFKILQVPVEALNWAVFCYDECFIDLNIESTTNAMVQPGPITAKLLARNY